MLLSDTAYDAVWDRIYENFHFRPSIDPSVVPFVFDCPYRVYDVRTTHEAALDLIPAAFARCTAAGERMYALEWQSSAFLFDPRDPDTMASRYVADDRYFGGGYNANFPDWYPDGDYCFFLAEDFRFGYLGHPWRQEVWIFGGELLKAFEEIAAQLGWTAKADF